MIFDRWIDNFISNYHNDKKVETIISEIRNNLQFNDCPSLKLMEIGEVDCAGSAMITAKILERLVPEFSFKIAAFPNLPWMDREIADSKHCGVVQCYEDKPIYIIDPTPINGYGYGKISRRIIDDEWVNDGNSWVIKKWLDIGEFEYWENILYPVFLLIDDIEIEKILHIDNVRFFLRKKEYIKIISDPPKYHKGWIKEYWRTSAQIADSGMNIKLARDFYARAIEIAPHNPYLLKEYVDFIERNKINYDLTNLKADYEKYTDIAIHDHERSVVLWNKKLNSCIFKKDWMSYLYYLGIIFWRGQSLSLLKGEKPQEIENVLINNNPMPFYRLSPAWFKNQRNGLILSKNKIGDDNILLQLEYSINHRIKDFYFDFLGINPDALTGYVNVVNKDFKSKEKCIYDSVKAHQLLFSLTRPELLII